MIEEQGRVIALDGDWALVEPLGKSACGHCAMREGCGTGIVGRFLGARRRSFRALNRAGAAVGDLVRIGIPEDALLGASVAVYLLPLLAFLVLAGIGVQTSFPAGWPDDLRALVWGGSGLAVTLACLRMASQRSAARFHPVVYGLVDSSIHPVRSLRRHA